NTTYLQQNNSNIYGESFFHPFSPNYNTLKPSTSNVNYYNLYQEPVEKENSTTINNIMPDYKHTTNNLDSSETYSHHLASPRNFHTTSGANNPLFPDGIQPKLQNIVSTANLKCELDLR